MKQLRGNVLITGGAGTLGQAIIRRALAEHWDCELTVYSRDVYKHLALRDERQVRFVLGDIGDQAALTKLFAGMDLVIHAAAQKHIPQGEHQPLVTMTTNVIGSINVLESALAAGVKHILAISTDKVCHSVNTYGATKYLMEKVYQEHRGYAQINLCRYGNVLGSNGSVLTVWAKQAKTGPLTITRPDMTRFWLTENGAVDVLLNALDQQSGVILVPRLKSASIGDMAKALYPDCELNVTGLRPGEKLHEELVTAEESIYTDVDPDKFLIWPTTTAIRDTERFTFTSENAERLTEQEIKALAC